ncbi:flagellar hook assembly protein FlgD [soil metagenome]
MSTAPISAAQATATVNAGVGSLANNYTTFLQLLTTQLKNQDPLSPLDTNQFTGQLTAMTGVQQQLLTNQLLTQMLSQNQGGLSTSSVNLIGKQVSADVPNTTLAGGKADWSYNLGKAAASTKLEIIDSNGRLVWTGSAADNAAGAHAFSWNGKDNSNRQLPDGIYNLKVTAVDSNTQAIASTISVSGIATGVEMIDGQTLLTVGGSKVPISTVTGVKAAPGG